MPPVADIRVGLLNSFVAEVGGQNAAASLLGYKAPAYVRQMLGLVPAKPRAITEKSILAWLKHTDQRRRPIQRQRAHRAVIGDQDECLRGGVGGDFGHRGCDPSALGVAVAADCLKRTA